MRSGQYALFHLMRDLADMHRASHARTALERVQQPLQQLRLFLLVRPVTPCTQPCAYQGAQLARFFQEYQQQLFIHLVPDLRFFRFGGEPGSARSRSFRPGTLRHSNFTAQLILAGNQLFYQVGARLRHLFSADALRHRLERVDSLFQQRQFGRIERNLSVDMRLQPAVQGIGQFGHNGKTHGAIHAGQCVRGAHEIVLHQRSLPGAQFVELLAQHGRTLHGFHAGDIEQCRRQRDPAYHNHLLRRHGGWSGERGLRFRSCRLIRHDAVFNLLRGGNQLIRFDTRPALAVKRVHPAGEFLRRLGDKTQQPRRSRFVVLQPFIQCALDAPGNFAQIGQTDHAPAALEGMKAAPDGHQRLAAVRLQLADLQIVAHGAQHFLRLFQEHLKQFPILTRCTLCLCRNAGLFARNGRLCVNLLQPRQPVQSRLQGRRVSGLPVRQMPQMTFQRAHRPGQCLAL